MKAVVMAGGHGTRLRPALAPTINKHLFPVGGKPLICWPLETIAAMGISDVLVILNGCHPQLLMEVIGNGKSFKLDVWYRYNVETNGPSVARTLYEAKGFVGEEQFVLILGDSVFLKPPILPQLETHHAWVMQSDAKWDDMSKYALLPGSLDLIQTGMWSFTSSVFPAIKALEERSTLRIRDLVKYLHQHDSISHTEITPRSFIDAGTHTAIEKINKLI